MSAPYPSPAFTAFGILGTVTRNAGRHEITGWAVAPDAGPIDALRVFVGAREVAATSTTGRSSPEVAAANPTLPDAANAGFTISITDDAVGGAIEDELLAVVPFSGGRPGNPIFTLVQPTVVLPTDETLKITGGSFKAAYEFLGYFLGFCELRPDQSVLEVGCGCGRMAYPLAYYLQPPGRYEGFDIVTRLIDSARDGVTTTRPHVRFQVADVFNSVYNRAGKQKSSEFVFPYPDASFDFVFLTSVFTHMYPADVRRYLSEIRRVLRPGGRVLMTCFLRTPDAVVAIDEGRSSQSLRHPREECWIAKPEAPEFAVGFAPEQFFAWVEAAGFAVERFAPGFWCGRPRRVSYQDIVVAS